MPTPSDAQLSPDSPEAVFPNPRDPEEVVDRRAFMATSAASAALAGIAGCSPRRAPRGEIVPYVRPPEHVTPGEPLTFATATELRGTGIGLLVESREGRPVKVEGNPDHPGSLGSTDLFSQAILLGLYDPDRSRHVLHRNVPATWDEAIRALRDKLFEPGDGQPQARKNVRLRVLAGATASPAFASLAAEFLKAFPAARWITHEPCGGPESGERPVYDFSKADVVLSIGADFLSCEPGNVRYQRDFADRRRVRKDGTGGVTAAKMSRLYVVETMFTTTGANADHRVALKPSEIEPFARDLAAFVGQASGHGGSLSHAIARDLRDHRGHSLVIVGETQPASLHALGRSLNESLGNIGNTARYIPPLAIGSQSSEEFANLVREMAAGQVDVLLVLGANPAYTSPADVPFAEAVKKVGLSVHLGLYADETAELCEWHLPEAHDLESWGDARGYDGTVAIRQPLIEPLFGGRSAMELLAVLLTGHDRRGRDLVRDKWRQALGNPADFDAKWEAVVQKGVIEQSTKFRESEAAAEPKKEDREGQAPPGSGPYELAFLPDPCLHDGRFANNGWLQELPKPVTKLTWDNAAFMSPATAAKLDIQQSTDGRGGQHGGIETDVVILNYRGRSVHAPVLVAPGHADDAVSVYLGHGRWKAGSVGIGVGFNAYRLRTSDSPWSGRGLEIVRTNERAVLACTQSHHSMEDREPVRHTTAAEFAKKPDFIESKLNTALEKAAVTAISNGEPPPAEEREPRLVPLSLYDDWPYPDHKWGMAIDLSACTGCSACVVACQAENNIPVVGKEQVIRGREMHWLRIDRYSAGGREFFQPVPCMQCENAPCEYVCPVHATVHSHDGLNDMSYNRCVGTRYCSNNCPYKVRRFNFLAFAEWDAGTSNLARNPEVTVRSRGVMEKCTYCVQRIRNAELEAQQARKPIPDGRIQTACQQACPSQAIVFGDLNDTGAEVRKWKSEPHNYSLLEELNTRPRTTYLGAVRNPNSAMPGGE